MDILLIIAVIVIALGVLGLVGIFKLLKGAAWLILIIGALILVASFVIA